VNRGDVDADSKDEDGRTPISHAARNGYEAVLVDRDDIEADSKDENSRTPLLHAERNGHKTVVRLLQSNKRLVVKVLELEGGIEDDTSCIDMMSLDSNVSATKSFRSIDL
jgi:ankyrin repeat protein